MSRPRNTSSVWATTPRHLDLEIREVTRAALEGAHRDIESAEEIDCVLPEPVEPHLAVLRLADDYHLLLLELVDAVNAALFYTVSALFLAEAGGVAREGQWQSLRLDYCVNKLAYHRVLARADEIEILALDFIHHRVHLGKAHNAGDDIASYHERRHTISEAAVDHEIARI